MKILVIGGGGREHALCWKLAQSRRRPRLYCAPGNAGTAQIAENVPIAQDDLAGLFGFARKNSIDLTVVGPEDPLCAGIVDRFNEAGLRIFGPTAGAARIEGDKIFAKQLMREVGIPTAESRVFEPTAQEMAQARQRGQDRDEQAFKQFQSGYDMAREYLVTRDEGVVVKAAGLAKGKGVFVHPDPEEAMATVEALMVKKTLGEAGARIVIEEILTGPEISVMALVDGTTIYVLETASDHKRIGELDTGPNTGGMGAYSPSEVLDDAAAAQIVHDVLVPAVDALSRQGVIYRGVLYAGLIMTAAGPRVLEFNCRFGDPETQPVLMRLKSDLVDVFEACVEGRLSEMTLEWERDPAVCVVLASKGYPDSYETGKTIIGLEQAAAMPLVQVFHSGTVREADRVVTSGGRVLSVTALGDSIKHARERAYEAAKLITFDGAYMRGDIGMRASGR